MVYKWASGLGSSSWAPPGHSARSTLLYLTLPGAPDQEVCGSCQCSLGLFFLGSAAGAMGPEILTLTQRTNEICHGQAQQRPCPIVGRFLPYLQLAMEFLPVLRTFSVGRYPAKHAKATNFQHVLNNSYLGPPTLLNERHGRPQGSDSS